MMTQYCVTEYKVPGAGRHLKIALVSDLHEHEAPWMLSLLKKEMPDLILIAGDTLERNDRGEDPRSKEKKGFFQRLIFSAYHVLVTVIYSMIGRRNQHSSDNAFQFLREVSKIAPVYMSLGNHEWYLNEEDHQLFKSCGITLLDNSDVKVRIKETELSVGGLSPAADLQWLSGFAQKPGYKILLCHHPEYYEQMIQGTSMDCFDLILSGHCHGGQWRIGKKGFFAPGQGFFPKYCHGSFTTKGGVMIVSAGCSNTAGIPRFGNPCELVMIETGKGMII